MAWTTPTTVSAARQRVSSIALIVGAVALLTTEGNHFYKLESTSQSMAWTTPSTGSAARQRVSSIADCRCSGYTLCFELSLSVFLSKVNGLNKKWFCIEKLLWDWYFWVLSFWFRWENIIFVVDIHQRFFPLLEVLLFLFFLFPQLKKQSHRHFIQELLNVSTYYS